MLMALRMMSSIISIHALREEGDRQRFLRVVQGVEFLSTPSARRATFGSSKLSRCRTISIHALREEGDQRCPHPAALA